MFAFKKTKSIKIINFSDFHLDYLVIKLEAEMGIAHEPLHCPPTNSKTWDSESFT
jgi:hypothetical protein